MSFSLTERRIRREGERGKYVKVLSEILFCEKKKKVILIVQSLYT